MPTEAMGARFIIAPPGVSIGSAGTEPWQCNSSQGRPAGRPNWIGACPMSRDMTLRDVIADDLPIFFAQQLDPGAN
jgi:hypothetical protein